MIIHVEQEVPVYKSYAAERTRGLYNVDADDGRRFVLDVDLPVGADDNADWQIGVVVGPSGSGKSSILRWLSAGDADDDWATGDEALRVFDDRPIIEVLSAHKGYEKACGALSSVGLGSVPSWLRPFSVLSMGEQFRAHMAALLLPGDWDSDRIVLDEFTSVLDRQVAQVGAGAFAKSWRRKEGRRIILFTCHYDVLDWVQPDWWVDTAEGADKFGADRGVVAARKGSFQEANHRARYRGDTVGTLEL